jgi:hypothetical protein
MVAGSRFGPPWLRNPRRQSQLSELAFPATNVPAARRAVRREPAFVQLCADWSVFVPVRILAKNWAPAERIAPNLLIFLACHAGWN